MKYLLSLVIAFFMFSGISFASADAGAIVFVPVFDKVVISSLGNSPPDAITQAGTDTNFLACSYTVEDHSNPTPGHISVGLTVPEQTEYG